MVYIPIKSTIVQKSTKKSSPKEINSQSMDHADVSNMEVLYLGFDTRTRMKVVKILIKASPALASRFDLLLLSQ